MTTQTIVKKLNQEVEALHNEVRNVKKVLFSTLYDTEGEYKTSFIRKALARSKEPAKYRFTSKTEFLKHVRSSK